MLNNNYGLKYITKENAIEIDPTNELWYAYTKENNFEHMDFKVWLDLFNEPKLSEEVPIDVRILFEVARGTIIYGYYYYPLYMVGMEQLFRIMECAVSLKCKECKEFKKGKGTFNQKIKFLSSKGLLDEEYWELVRNLRNFCSHPNVQNLLPPANVYDELEQCAERINHLFANIK